MAIARNLVANSVNQGVSFLVNIIAVPIYLSQLGVEQYGLVGFGIVVQTWINLLEAGMSGTLGREMTRFKVGRAEEEGLLSFLRSLDHLFLGAIILLPLLAIATSGIWSKHWFGGSSIGRQVISESIVLVIALAAVRMAATLYRGGLMGLERQVFASWVSIICSLARLLLPLPFVVATRDVRTLFVGWLLISAVELLIVRLALASAFTVRLPWRHFSASAFRERTHIWGSIGIVAVIWTVVSQADKLILARVLSLHAYGEFTLVMVLSNALLSIPGPIALAYQPRFTAAAAHNDRAELARLVNDATRLIAVLAVAPAVVLALMPGLAIFGWTGSREAAAAVSSYAGFYLIGSSLIGTTTVVYCMQLAYGDLRLHVRAMAVAAIFLVPGVFVIAQNFGADGAARLWLLVNLALFLLYDPIALRRFLPGEGLHWYGVVIAPPLIAAAAAAFGAVQFRSEFSNFDRMTSTLVVVAIELFACAAAAGVAYFLWKQEGVVTAAPTAPPVHDDGAGHW